ncbi:translation initiation factor eIF-2B alpha subunit [Pseudohyphozyma bogoriensis]|nr:translation initiation factor eIF-2B alpha subunit [Pseudohyphozyma bogoriensis]
MPAVVEEHDDLFSAPTKGTKQPFDVVAHYNSILAEDDTKATPIAAIESLAALISQSNSNTMTELLALLHEASSQLANASFTPISLSCGTALFLRFVILSRPPPEMSFKEFKEELVETANELVRGSTKCREAIAQHTADFIRDGMTLLVHSYSRVVVQALLYAAQVQKKRFNVYVTESRPMGLGLKTHAILSQASIETAVILDSSVAYIMGKVDACIVGAEAVCESGGLVNYIGGYGLAIAAKALGKPLYALAESYKFCRVFPLSQYDLPSSLATPPLSFPVPSSSKPSSIPPTPSRPMLSSPMPVPLEMSDDMTRSNPTLDYTGPELISLIISDLGVMSPSGISDALLSIFGGE